MAVSLETLKSGISKLPPRILIYGEEKIGKTTFGTIAPNPIFLRTEDGAGNLDMTYWDIECFQDFLDAVNLLMTQPHDFQTVVIDSIDWFDRMVQKQLMTDRPKTEKGDTVKSLDDYGYGKGYEFVMETWQIVFDCLRALHEKGMIIVMIAHAGIEKVNPPDGNAYDRIGIKMHKKVADKFFEFSDCIFYARRQVVLMSDTNTKDKKAPKKAFGSYNDQRELITVGTPAIRAGNRYNLSPVIPFDESAWAEIASKVPFFEKYNQPTTTTTTKG